MQSCSTPRTPSLILHTLNLPSSTLCFLITWTSSPSISSQPHVPKGQQLSLCPGTELDVQVAELSLLCSEHCGGAACAKCPHYARRLETWSSAADGAQPHLPHGWRPTQALPATQGSQGSEPNLWESLQLGSKRHMKWKW